MTLYLEVTKDKYELPLAVADSIAELAKMRMVTRSTIDANISRWKKGIVKKSKYIEVKVDA